MIGNIRIKRIIAILIVTLLMLTTNIYAANDRFDTTLKASNTQLKREDKIEITIGLNNISIESGDKGIGAYTARVKFDTSVLEYVSTSGTDKWEAPLYQNGQIVGNTKDGEVVNTAQAIGTITFRVKKDAKLGDTIISLENFSGTTAQTDVEAKNTSIKVTVVDQNGGNNNSGNTGTSSNQKPTGNNASNNVDNKKQAKLPQTGNNDILIITAIGGCVTLAIVSYVKYKSLGV